MKRLISRILSAALVLLLLLVVIIAVLLLSPAPDPPQALRADRPILLKGGLVVDIERDTLLRQDVLVVDGYIQAVGVVGSMALPPETRVVDATGRYLIPGLWDMHIHLLPALSEQLTLPLFVANGVTNVRELGGLSFETKQALNRGVAKREILGPRIQAFAGAFVRWLDSEEAAKEVVAEFAGEKHDFIKVYNAVLPEYYFPLVTAARAENIPVLGHKPRAVSALQATRAGHLSFEHARLFLFECYPGAEHLRQAYHAKYTGETEGGFLDSPEELRRMVDTHSDSMFTELALAMVEHQTWFCPTHITRKMDALADDPSYRNDPRLKYIHFLQTRSWDQDADGMVENDESPAGRQAYRDFYEKGLELTAKAHDLGVKVLAGTDANDTYSFPGHGLHEELAELVKAGLTPAEALQTATLLPAEYFELTDTYGSISPGKVADILVLTANPLEDIANTEAIDALVYQGSLYDRQHLDELLIAVEEAAASWTVGAHLLWEVMMGQD